MSRKKKRKDIKLTIRKETSLSVVAVFSILIGILIMVSFTGKGAVLSGLNQYLIQNFGLAMLFLPFIFFASGMVLFQTKWEWSKPHILLGTVFMMIGTMGLMESGEIGLNVYTNLASLITKYGAIAFF